MELSTSEYRDRLWTASRHAHRLLSGERPLSMAEQLATLASSGVDLDRRPDVYGDGLVEELEQKVAGLLGLTDAVWFPTGTMAQQAALRHWADKAGVRTVALHPLHHTLLHEGKAFEAVAGLSAVYPTEERRHPTAAEVSGLPGQVAAVVLELPFQELGYPLPTWDAYLDLAAATRARGAALHVDGARLWETQPWFGRSLEEIAAVPDSVYVSFYKALGGLSGAALAGGEELVSAARTWRHRYGGKTHTQWPSIVSTLHGLSSRLQRIPVWTEHAGLVARALTELPGTQVIPTVPHIRQFRVRAPHPAKALNQAVLEITESEGRRFLHGWWDDGGGALGEMTVGDAALAWTPAEIVDVGHRVLERAAEIASSNDN